MLKRLDRINDSLSIYQFTDGFSYGTDAVLLSAYTKVKKGAVGAEFGTGTGIIPILLCHHKSPRKIYAFEIQEDYADLARENVKQCSFDGKIDVICDDIKNIVSSYPAQHGMEDLDFVFTNPPYMKMDSGYLNLSRRKLTARHELFCNIDDICQSAYRLLKNGGDFFIIYRPDRLCDLLCAMRQAKIEPKSMTEVVSKQGQAPTLVLVKGQKQASPSMKVTRPLVIYNDDGSYTDEMMEIYEKGVL